jgi:electron transfer flavoprotein beta subunit
LNPYDLYAVEAGLELSARTGGRTTALSMGPPQARQALLETLYMGVEQAILVSDRRFAGSDVLATAYALSQAIKTQGFDLIICGKQTTDGDTAQVGAEIAEFLGIPHAANVKSMHPATRGFCDDNHGINGEGRGSSADIDNGMIIVSEREYQLVTQYMPLPCLLCVDGGINTPRLPSYKKKRDIAGDPVILLTMADMFDQNESNYGLSGSPTQVERTFVPAPSTEREVYTGSGAELAAKLAEIMAARKYI